MSKYGTVYLVLFFILLVLLAFNFEGTGGEGDSVHHFLYARYAFERPELFFKHWAKPVWVMLMAPVAQLGFTALKIAGAVCLVGASYFGLRIARKLELKPEVFSVLTLATMPMAVQLSLSGLTEPLFAFWLMAGIWLYFEDRDLLATAWLSFLPLVRSEGLIVFCVIIIYLLLRKRWLGFLLLPLGHLVIGLLGYPVYKNITWVIHEIPYTQMDGAAGYGVGKWSHYFTHFHLIIGDFNVVLLTAGMLVGLYRLVMYWSGRGAFLMKEMWLIYGMFTAYFIAHTIFWTFGIFNSAGLLRVFLAVLPLVCLVIGRVLELMWAYCRSLWMKAAFIVLFTGFSVWSQPDWRDYKYALDLHISQEAFRDYVKQHPGLKEKTIYTEFVDAAYFLGIDFFDKNRFRNTNRLLNGMTIPQDAIVFWHNRWSITEAHMPLDVLLNHDELVLIDSIKEWETKAFYVFEKKNRDAQLDAHTLLFKSYVSDTLNQCTTQSEQKGNVRKLHGDCQYSEGIKLLSQELPANATEIVVIAQMLPVYHDRPTDVHLVLSYENGTEKALHYSSQKVMLDGKANWEKVELKASLPTGMPNDATVKCYFWNTGTENPILLDSLTMKWR